MAFLRWLNADNFTFLGTREYAYTGSRVAGQLAAMPRLRPGPPPR